MHSMKKNATITFVIQKLLLVVVGIFMFLPIYIALVNTFKDSGIILNEPLSFPLPPIFDNIRTVLDSPNTDLVQLYKNTFILVFAGTAITILVSSMAS